MIREQTLSKGAALGREAGLILLGASVTAVAAQITIPIEPVPFTLQTFAVMICGLTLGARRAVAAQLTYLSAGVVGLPVFAGYLGGPQALVGKTGGYLVSFLAVAALLGWCSDRGWSKKVFPCAAFLIAAITLNLGLGAAWLAVFIGAPAALAMGIAPFLGIELGKAAVTALIVPGARKWLG